MTKADWVWRVHIIITFFSESAQFEKWKTPWKLIVGLYTAARNPELSKIFSYLVYLSTSCGKKDVYSILLETFYGLIMGSWITNVQSVSPTHSPKLLSLGILLCYSLCSLAVVLIRCYMHLVFHQMLISMPGMKRSWKVLVSGCCVSIG